MVQSGTNFWQGNKYTSIYARNRTKTAEFSTSRTTETVSVCTHVHKKNNDLTINTRESKHEYEHIGNVTVLCVLDTSMKHIKDLC